MYSEIINGEEYRLVSVRGREKLVSKHGDLINPKRRNQKAKWSLNRDGYPATGGGGCVHLYVALAWVDGWFEGAEVDHIDFDRTNFDYTNLRWVTHQENIKHSVNDNGDVYSAWRKGEGNPRARFTEEQVKEIRELHDNGMSVMDIVRKFEHTTTYEETKKASGTYYYIVNNKSWKEI